MYLILAVPSEIWLFTNFPQGCKKWWILRQPLSYLDNMLSDEQINGRVDEFGTRMTRSSIKFALILIPIIVWY